MITSILKSLPEKIKQITILGWAVIVILFLLLIGVKLMVKRMTYPQYNTNEEPPHTAESHPEIESDYYGY